MEITEKNFLNETSAVVPLSLNSNECRVLRIGTLCLQACQGGFSLQNQITVPVVGPEHYENILKDRLSNLDLIQNYFGHDELVMRKLSVDESGNPHYLLTSSSGKSLEVLLERLSNEGRMGTHRFQVSIVHNAQLR